MVAAAQAARTQPASGAARSSCRAAGRPAALFLALHVLLLVLLPSPPPSPPSSFFADDAAPSPFARGRYGAAAAFDFFDFFGGGGGGGGGGAGRADRPGDSPPRAAGARDFYPHSASPDSQNAQFGFARHPAPRRDKIEKDCREYFCANTRVCVSSPAACPCPSPTDVRCPTGNWHYCVRGDQTCDSWTGLRT
ncbi:MAG: hypothetical protein BJ554DRAFT_8284 [Olpidium bornovanus]|uniref:Uncharacterized protein n=1 Tax=Olpidium bornovanus TaxID=278681 RepID=A0A8H8DIE2_9FUNG|nr:MAG: hypothetical protein BJ554DRAFT_8284 [Olpidium bornovanus]